MITFDKSKFFLVNGIYCQKGYNANEFENEYITIRTKEGRIHDDNTVKQLPFIDDAEWKIRSASTKRLLKYLKKEKTKSLIEVGCGNGWLTNYLQRGLDAVAFGIDINRVELEQAARTGAGTFFYGDIFSNAFSDFKADAIILAACIQYFPDLRRLINILRPKGSIHIIDSPIYETGAAAEARERSRKYFDSKDAAAMQRFYFHHEVDTLKDSGAGFLYTPNRAKTLLGGSPFPWIMIRKAP